MSLKKFFLFFLCLFFVQKNYADVSGPQAVNAPAGRHASITRMSSTDSSGLQPAGLRCEYLRNPLGIDVKHPRFSWAFISKGRNKFQSAYELILSARLSDLQQKKGSDWSTGKMISSQNNQIVYDGKPLQSFSRYYWRIKVYDEKGRTLAWSDVNWFETAMLDNADWKAQWIGDGLMNPAKDEDYYKENRMPLFRKNFSSHNPVKTARLYISGLGYYEAFFNGKKVGNRMLDPGFTKYSKTVLYSVYDVSSLMRSGENTAAIRLGSGWWDPLPLRIFGRIDLRRIQQTGRPCVKAQIRITYANGEVSTIGTDETWQTAPGPVTHNNVYLGEEYDARYEQKNWNRLNPDLAVWKPAKVVDGPSGKLIAQMQPPIRITKEVIPVKITEMGKDTFIVDMGQNFAGVVRIRVSGPSGRKVNLRYGEDLFKDGRLNYMTTVATQIKKGGISGGPGAPVTAWQEDSYILKGMGREVWDPTFTFHGFRYVEITGWPGKPVLADITGLRMNSDLETAGHFSCSNDMFNQLHRNIQWTFLSNVFSVQSDCPGREKMGYGADMVVSANSFQYNYDMSQFYSKSVHDFADEQQADGAITEIAPYTGIADRGYGGDSGPLGWELAFPYLQDQLYDWYGDKEILEKNADALRKQMEFLESKAVDNLFSVDIGDHETLDPKPEAFNAACFYYHHALLAKKFAEILNRKEDSLKYDSLAEKIRDAIIRKYYSPETGTFDNGTESAQLFGLWYGLSPDKSKSIARLKKAFEEKNWHLSTGIFSTKMLFDVLRNNNLNEWAYKIADQKDFPGWGYMIAEGATTLWETWAYPKTSPSQNHPMFGSVDEWFYRSLLGISGIGSGFTRIEVKPQPAGDLRWAKGSYRSIQGDILASWRKGPPGFELSVSVPPNTTANIYIPCALGGKVYERNTAVKVDRYTDGYAVIETGSGNYEFHTNTF
jgi:alpha-L-rhamnosidase